MLAPLWECRILKVVSNWCVWRNSEWTSSSRRRRMYSVWAPAQVLGRKGGNCCCKHVVLREWHGINLINDATLFGNLIPSPLPAAILLWAGIKTNSIWQDTIWPSESYLLRIDCVLCVTYSQRVPLNHYFHVQLMYHTLPCMTRKPCM